MPEHYTHDELIGHIAEQLGVIEGSAMQEEYCRHFDNVCVEYLEDSNYHVYRDGERGEYSEPQEICPCCKSSVICNYGPPEGDRLEVTCNDCSFQWIEPVLDVSKQGS